MNASEIIKSIEAEQLKAEVPQFNVGDTVKVYGKIKEGNRERIQVFEGTVLILLKRPCRQEGKGKRACKIIQCSAKKPGHILYGTGFHMECVPVFSHCKAPKLNCEATGFVLK